jgi:hypothetical protein
MSKVDLAKEQIAYLKLWLGIFVAILVSLTGWLMTNFQTADFSTVIASVLGLVFICYIGYALHKRIEQKISSLEEL